MFPSPNVSASSGQRLETAYRRRRTSVQFLANSENFLSWATLVTKLRPARPVAQTHLTLAELERALAYPGLRKRISHESAVAFVSLLRQEAPSVIDPEEPPVLSSSDPDDEYLGAHSDENKVALVSRDTHLLDLSQRIPVFTPRQFFEVLAA